MTLLAIDGNSILNRAFYGIRMLTNSKGVPTNALFGFFNIYLKEAAQVQPEAVAVAFDLPAPTFRHKASADYKANRKGMPEDLARQLGPVKELLRGMGITVLETEGYEADDIPLMVEAIPLSTESIILVITKVEYPEEMDVRFSNFSEPDESLGYDENDSVLSNVKGADDILDLFKKMHDEKEEPKAVVKEVVDLTKMFEFNNLDEACRLAKIIVDYYQGNNDL